MKPVAERLKDRLEQVLGITIEKLTLNEIFLALNKYNTTSETTSFFHILAPSGEIFLMYKTPLWDISETTTDETDFILSDVEQDGFEPVAIGYVQPTGLKINPLLPLDQQDELGNQTLEAILQIFS